MDENHTDQGTDSHCTSTRTYKQIIPLKMKLFVYYKIVQCMSFGHRKTHIVPNKNI